MTTRLHKKGIDEENLKNWRPIALLNTDYDTMTKTLAKRLEKVIPFLIHPSQAGFVKKIYGGRGFVR